MSAFTDFANEWLGKRVTVDAGNDYECVELIKQYLIEVYGLGNGAWGNAIDYWNNTAPAILEKFDKVASTTVAEGDIVVLVGINGNTYGHITIASGQQTDATYQALEQNGFDGSGNGEGGNAIRYRDITKSRIAGILRPKVAEAPIAANVTTGGTNDMIDQPTLTNLYQVILGRDPDQGAIDHYVGNYSTSFVVNDLIQSDEYKQDEANRSAASQQTNDRIADLQGQLQAASSAQTANAAQIADLTSKLKAETDIATALQTQVDSAKATATKIPVTVVESAPATPAPAATPGAKSNAFLKAIESFHFSLAGATVLLTAALADPHVQNWLALGLDKYVTPALLGLGLSTGLVTFLVNLVKSKLTKVA